MSSQWDYRDDYYFTQIGSMEINIRAYSKNELSLWMYEYSSDEELVDADCKSLLQLQEMIKEVVGAKIITPTLESLLKVTNGEEKMYDPKASYYERQNSCQRAGARRRESSKFRDSIGGCSSNYRD